MSELDYIITNGYCDIDTIENRKRNGWDFVVTLPAILIEPHAMPTDKVTIFSKISGLLERGVKPSIENCTCNYCNKKE